LFDYTVKDQIMKSMKIACFVDEQYQKDIAESRRGTNVIKFIKLIYEQNKVVKIKLVQNKEYEDSTLPLLIFADQELIDKRQKNDHVFLLVEQGYKVAVVDKLFFRDVDILHRNMENIGLRIWAEYINDYLNALRYLNQIYEDNISFIGVGSSGSAFLVAAALSGIKFNVGIMMQSIIDFDYILESGLWKEYFTCWPYFENSALENRDNISVRSEAYKKYPELKLLNPPTLLKLLKCQRLVIINDNNRIYNGSIENIIEGLDYRENVRHVLREKLDDTYISDIICIVNEYLK